MDSWKRVAAAFGLALAAPALADEGAVDYRHHTMEAIGGHMQAIVDIAQGKVAHRQHMAIHVNALADLAEITDTLFPEGSAGGESLDAIWENPDDFAMKVADFKEAAAALKAGVAAGDPGGLRAVGQACKACHDNYRAE